MLKDLTGVAHSALEPVDSAELAGQPVPMLKQIAQLCTRAFADYCAIYVRNGGPKPVAASTRIEGCERLDEAPYDDLLTERYRAAGLNSLFIEHLTTNGHQVGSLVLGMRADGDLSDIDRQVLSTLGSILSTVIEQARQLAHHYRVSSRLQRALLPSGLAHAPDISFDAAYRPADDESEVGGDWYDAFDIGNGTIGISIGDVTGHGLEAAVSMSEIRRVIRSAALHSDSPSAILDQVDEVISSEGIGMATSLVGIYHVGSGVLRYASAGHPAPILLLRNGRTVTLPAGGLLLGLGMEPASTDWTVTLPPGSACYLFTDGLLEYTRDIVEGERNLVRALEDLHTLAGGPDARTLHEHIFAKARNTDDAATLVLSRSDAPGTEITLQYSALPQFASLAREALRSFGAQFMDDDQLFDFLTATGEAVANGIEHGAQEPDSKIEIKVHDRDGDIVVEIASDGHWRAFTPRDERGRGVPIMRACARTVEISSTSDRTTVGLVFKYR